MKRRGYDDRCFCHFVKGLTAAVGIVTSPILFTPEFLIFVIMSATKPYVRDLSAFMKTSFLSRYCIILLRVDSSSVTFTGFSLICIILFCPMEIISSFSVIWRVGLVAVLVQAWVRALFPEMFFLLNILP